MNIGGILNIEFIVKEVMQIRCSVTILKAKIRKTYIFFFQFPILRFQAGQNLVLATILILTDTGQELERVLFHCTGIMNYNTVKLCLIAWTVSGEWSSEPNYPLDSINLDFIIIIIIINFYSPVSNTRCHSIGHKMRIARIKIRVDSPGRWERA